MLMEHFHEQLVASAPRLLTVSDLPHILLQVQDSFPHQDDPLEAFEEAQRLLQSWWSSSSQSIIALMIAAVAVKKTGDSQGRAKFFHELQQPERLDTTVRTAAIGFLVNEPSLQEYMECDTSFIFQTSYFYAVIIHALVTETHVPSTDQIGRIAASLERSSPRLQLLWLDHVKQQTRAVVQALYMSYDAVLQHMPSDSLLPLLENSRSSDSERPHFVATVTTLSTTTAQLLDRVAAPSPSFLVGAIDILAWVTFLVQPENDLVNKAVRTIPPAQIPSVLAPLHESLKADQGRPLHLDVLRGNRVRFYLTYLSRNATQNLDTLFDLAIVGAAHTLRPLHDLSHRILRVLARSGTSEMAVVYVRQMIQQYPDITTLGVIATGIGYILSRPDHDSALVRFYLAELYSTWDNNREANGDLARLIFELLKVVRMDDLGIALLFVEKMVWKDSTLLEQVYETISVACDAPRRIPLLEWFLRLQAQLAPLPSNL
ncbi:unnamed protein product [Aphanomyces euteiches]